MKFNYTDLKIDHDKPFIRRIRVKHIFEDNPDLSFLKQNYFNDNPKYPLCSQADNEKYQAQDKKRLEAYDNNEWCMMGIVAETDILVPQHTVPPSYRIVPITSGGIWGNESDADWHDVEDEQIADLKDLCKTFNVEVPDNVVIDRDTELTYE